MSETYIFSYFISYFIAYFRAGAQNGRGLSHVTSAAGGRSSSARTFVLSICVTICLLPTSHKASARRRKSASSPTIAR